MFLLVPAYPGCPGSKAVKRSLLLLFCPASVLLLFTARRYASAVHAVVVSVYPCFRPSVCHKPLLCRNDWTNQAGFLAWGRLSTRPILPHVIRKYGYLQKLGYSGTLSQTPDFSPRQVDRVVNKTRRRRRRSSLLTTPIRQSTSRGCFTSRSTVTL